MRICWTLGIRAFSFLRNNKVSLKKNPLWIVFWKKTPKNKANPSRDWSNPCILFALLKSYFNFFKACFFALNCHFYKQRVLVEPWTHQAEGGSAVSSSSPHTSPWSCFPLAWIPLCGPDVLFSSQEMSVSMAELSCWQHRDFWSRCSLPGVKWIALQPGADKQPQDFCCCFS